MLGTTKTYDRYSGCGFIISDDPNLADCFVHHTFINAPAAKKVLQPGDRVEFDYGEDKHGRPQARNVRKLVQTPPTLTEQRLQARQARRAERQQWKRNWELSDKLQPALIAADDAGDMKEALRILHEMHLLQHNGQKCEAASGCACLRNFDIDVDGGAE